MVESAVEEALRRGEGAVDPQVGEDPRLLEWGIIS